MVKKLTDYVLLNACSVTSRGLHNGKAGFALSLFKVGEWLQDSYIEEQAFELLQESLLGKSGDISFENGWAGIGYVLRYLIDNGLVDADFDELFRENMHIIMENIGVSDGSKAESYLSVCNLFGLMNDTDAVRTCASSVSSLLTSVGQSLKMNFSASLFARYVQVADCCVFMDPSREILYQYVDLYLRGRLASNFAIGHHLSRIAARLKDMCLQEVAERNKEMAIKNIFVDVMALSRRIDLLVLLHQDGSRYAEQIYRLERGIMDETDESVLENFLVSSIPVGLTAGYRSGIARLLLYYVCRATCQFDTKLFL